MPCIAVGGAGSAGWVAEGETEAGAAVEGADGNDKPHVLGDDVERQKIDFGGQIGRENGLLSAGSVGAAAGFDAVAGLGMAGGSGFDLGTEELLTIVGYEIVRVGVAEGLGYRRPREEARWRAAHSAISPRRFGFLRMVLHTP